MSSEHKVKNVFGQDMYQGSDGLYGSKYEADQTYRSDYKKENYHEPFQFPPINTPDPLVNQHNHSTISDVSGLSYKKVSPESRSRIIGLIILLAGGWINQQVVGYLMTNSYISFSLYNILATCATVLFWPTKLLLTLFGSASGITGLLLPYASPLANLLWILLVAHLLLKKGKLKAFLGIKSTGYKKASWIKAALIHLIVQIALTASLKFI